MPALNTAPNIAAADDFYARLIALHHGLTEAQSALVNARLILLLANHIGDPQVLDEAMRAARADIEAEEPGGGVPAARAMTSQHKGALP